MAWDSVPWFVGGGAEHSPEIARLMAYAATGGAEGVVTPGDLKVLPLSVPAGQVRVSTGASLVLNRSAGGAQQTYVGRLPVEDVVDIASTGSSAGRNDLVIARIEDPFTAGTPFQAPADPKVGPYIFTRVLPNVPASAIASPPAAVAYLASLGESAIPLAGIAMPVSTGTVTDTEIKDLRQVASPREKTETIALTGLGSQLVTPNAWGNFPSTAPNVDVPTWATHAQLTVTWSGLSLQPATTQSGHLRAALGDKSTALTAYVYDNGTTTNLRETAIVAGLLDVRSLAGTRTTVKGEGKGLSGNLGLDSVTHVLINITFSERVV